MNRNAVPFVLWITYVSVMMFSLSGCNDPDDMLIPSGRDVVITNATDTDPRVQIPENEALIPLKEVLLPQEHGRITSNPPEDLNYVLVLRAEVDAPQWENQTLQASHVVVVNNLAYVTYNTQGSTFQGGLDIIDVSNQHLPELKTQAIFPHTEFSSVAVEDTLIYLTGARLDEENLASPAVVEIFWITGGTLSEDHLTIDLPGYVGTDIKVDENYIYVTHGSNGGLSIYDKYSLDLIKTIPLDDARSLMLTDDQVMVMQGDPARISIISKLNWNIVQTFATDGATTPGAKSIFTLSDDAFFVPAGQAGLKILDRNSGSLVQHVPLPEIDGVEPEDIASNGVSMANDKLFVANGATGLYVLHHIDGAYQLFGSANFAASVNYVMSQENLMFVATGTGGLKIIEIVEYDPENGDYITIGDWDEYGRPNYLCETESAIDAGLEARINAQFIKEDDLTLRQPNWFGESVITDILLQEDTDIEITVLSETTYHQNTVGFYTYDLANKPNLASDLTDMTVVFPNATVTSSGSHLMKGDKVCLSGFEANSELGFFLVYKGFVDGQVTTGYKTHYSSQWLNKNRPIKQQNVLLADPEHQTLILAFEDVQRPYHDQDFDDGIFLITFSNPNAVNWSAFLELPE
ncbi:MAG: DUF4114 domain-containing protein [Cyclobacteriaceae bacterium]